MNMYESANCVLAQIYPQVGADGFELFKHFFIFLLFLFNALYSQIDDENIR